MQICIRWLAHGRVHVSVIGWATVFALQAAAGGPWSTPMDVGLRLKCGVVVSSKDESGKGSAFTPTMLRSGVAAGLTWQTNWGSGNMEPGFTLHDYGPAKFVPQFWGESPVSFENVREPGAPIMLGFNEPDQGHSGGSNMDVGRALDLWMKNVAQAKAHGYTMFVAPSIAQALPNRYTGAGVGNEWLPQFLQACLVWPGCAETINFLGFHMYDPNCPTDESVVRKWSMNVRVGSVKRLAEEFNQKGMNIKGLWLTEFAGRSENTGGKCGTLEQQKGWMEKVVPMLNAEPAVVGYSWFSYGDGRSPYFHDNANLWNYDDGSLNLLGQTYFDLCTTTDSESGSWFIYIVVILGLLMCAICVVCLRRRRIPSDPRCHAAHLIPSANSGTGTALRQTQQALEDVEDGQTLSELVNRADRSHTFWSLGKLLYCAKCGSYAESRIVDLKSTCPRAPSSSAKKHSLEQLNNGKHPNTGVHLGTPQPVGRN